MASGERGGWLAHGLTAKRVMIVAALFIVGYFGVLIASNAYTHVRLSREETALRAEIDTLERREQRLQALRRYMETDDFIERVARENGLVKLGETAIIQVVQNPEAGPSAESSAPVVRNWWDRYLDEDDRR